MTFEGRTAIVTGAELSAAEARRYEELGPVVIRA